MNPATPKSSIIKRSDQDPGSPIAHSTPDKDPKPPKIRGFKIRRLILPGDEKTEIDPDIRSTLRIFNVRCARQCNDVVLLHSMYDYYFHKSVCLLIDLCACELDFVENLISVIRHRLVDELHCLCVKCCEWRVVRMEEEEEERAFKRRNF